MSLRRIAVALLAASLLAGVHVGEAAAGTTHAPKAAFVRPSGGARFAGSVPYGAIRVTAFDRDVGRDNGNGIQRVVLTVRNAATGNIVVRRTERWAPYDFAVTLKQGRYTLNARAKSTTRAGGTWSKKTSITVTVDNGRAKLAKPASVITRQKAAAASLAALNRTRKNAGVDPVAMNTKMSDFAYHWSRKMVATGFRHSSARWAENIAWHSDDGMGPKKAAETFNRMWVNSSGHYTNMTNGGHDRVGIGLFRHKSGWWATHVFD